VTAWSLVLTVVLLLANGYFVAVEFALVGARRTRLEEEAAAGSRSAAAGVHLIDELSVQLAGAQLGITIASLLLGFVAEPAIAGLIESAVDEFVELPESLLHTIGFVVGLTIVVLAHMVIGEMVPKNLTLAAPERAVRILALPTRVYTAVFRPVIWLLNQMANLGVRVLGVEVRDTLTEAHSADELARMLAESQQEGLIEPEHKELLTSALGFGAAPVAEVMVPRHDVVWVPRSATVAEVEALIVGSGHSRVPVVGADLDEVVGFIHVKDLLNLRPDTRDEAVPERVIRPGILRVRSDRPVESVLLEMRRTRRHLAIAQDPDRRTQGLVTLEDLVEELVGDIRDESDRPEA
jgi:CBS domain containing-hemolysin-like protein